MNKKYLNFLILLLLGISPPLAGQYLNATSMALGLLISLGFIIVTYLTKLEWLFKSNKVILSTFAIVFIYGVFQHILVGFWELKSYYSLILLFIIVSVAYFFSKILVTDNLFDRKMIYYLTGLLIFFGFFAIVTDSTLSKLLYNREKGVFPFGEPSHFALFFGPFFILTVIFLKSNSIRFLLIFIVFLLSIFIESSTLLIYIFLVLLLFVRFSFFSVLIFIPFFLGTLYYFLTNDYFNSRLILSVDSTNLTSLVYLQGLTDAWLALKNTNGLGLGFQMLGSQAPSQISYQIAHVLGSQGGEVNRLDGGFLAAKIVAEFGVFGIFAIFGYLFVFIKTFLKLRRVMNSRIFVPNFYLFSLVFIYPLFVEFFVRGVGYFSPSLFLFFVAMFIYNTYSNRFL
ncbi:hypothetical protein [Algoriphagus aquimarinus]|uniref:O-antigen ligase family protein n=1 Tax=Algoriphagus aquimarinus TaxID=237018 RepID=A0A5C7AT55_9BACT|nr:hypothetical protein [Algoriphagus aquimarinus]TXE11497.1 hypothetical protein ESV85_11320 [Algoriphagus aquimarinus]